MFFLKPAELTKEDKFYADCNERGINLIDRVNGKPIWVYHYSIVGVSRGVDIVQMLTGKPLKKMTMTMRMKMIGMMRMMKMRSKNNV